MAAAKRPTKTGGSPRKTVASRPVLQWIAAGAGLIVTLAAAGVIVAEALQPARPVALTVRIEGERRTVSSRVFDVVVTNAGSETAAAVEVSGEAGGKTAAVTLDYVPGDGEASASLAFPIAAQGAPSIAVTGWSAP